MAQDAQLPRDEEETRLLAISAACRAKEHAAADQLLNPRHSLLHPTYLKLLDALAEAEAHRREGNTVVRFGSSEWSALLQNCDSVLPTTMSAERGNAETLVEFVLRFLSSVALD